MAIFGLGGLGGATPAVQGNEAPNKGGLFGNGGLLGTGLPRLRDFMDFDDPVTLMGLRMISNGLTPSIGAPRPFLDGVPEALMMGQQAQRQREQDAIAAEDRQKKQADENTTLAWLRENHPDLVAIYPSDPGGAMQTVIQRQEQERARNDPTRLGAAETFAGYGRDDLAAAVRNGMSLNDAWNMHLAPQSGADVPTDVQEYLVYQSQETAAGREPMGWLDYQLALKGNGTSLSFDPTTGAMTFNQGGSGHFNKTVDTGFGDAYTDINKVALSAIQGNSTLDAMEQAMADPSFYSGFGSDQLMFLKRGAAAFGIDPEGVTSMETFNSLSKKAALDLMGGSLGTGFSNADRDFITDQVANLSNSPEGNRQMIQIQRTLNQRAIQVAEMAEHYRRAHGQLDGGFTTMLAQWAEENQLFGGGTGGGVSDSVIDWRDL